MTQRRFIQIKMMFVFPRPYMPNKLRLTSLLEQEIDEETRAAISRVANIISVLAFHSVPMTDLILLEAYEWVVDHEHDAKGILQEEVGEALVAAMRAGG